MNLKNQHTIYTAADIEQYFLGKLTSEEMHAMERAALDDAFLADAMEGYSNLQENDWNEQLLKLKKEFSEKQFPQDNLLKKEVSLLSYWKMIAATIIICVGVAFLFFNSNQGTENKKIVSASEIDKLSDSLSKVPLITDTSRVPIQINPPANAQSSAKIKRDIKRKDTDNYLPSGKHKWKAGSKGSDIGKGGKGASNTDIFIDKNNLPPSLKNMLEQRDKNSNTAANKVTPHEDSTKNNLLNTPNTFSGLVVSPDGSPVAFTNIRVINSGLVTYADAKGNFKIFSFDSLVNLVIESEGFISREITLKKGEFQHKIVLLKNKKVHVKNNLTQRGLTLQKNFVILEHDSYTNAIPVDGWENYQIYSRNNINLPNDILSKMIMGEVIISFDVDINGQINNFKIVQSLSKENDKAVLKAVKNGPGWKLKNAVKANVTLKFRF